MIKIWDKIEPITQPNGVTCSAEEIKTDLTVDGMKAVQFGRKAEEVKAELEMFGRARIGHGLGFTGTAKNVLLTQESGVTVAVDNLTLILQAYGLDEELEGQEAIDAILSVREKQKEQTQSQAQSQYQGQGQGQQPMAAMYGYGGADNIAMITDIVVKAIPAVVEAMNLYKKEASAKKAK